MTTIGERLEDARKKKGISIREAAEATKIRGDYITKFEGNQFDIGLSEIYVRGFLKSYAFYLKLPADRLLNDYSSLGRGEGKRQPSREVYGRMDLSIAGGGDEPTERNPSTGPVSASDDSRKSFQPRRGNVPQGMSINPAALFKWGMIAVVAVVLILLVWGIKSMMSGPSTSAAKTHEPAPVQTVSSDTGPAATITIVALNDVKIKVARKSDSVELFQDWLKRGDRRDFPNIPLYLTATALQDVQIEYKGKAHSTGFTGRERVGLDFSEVR
jgi:transcriptional regulator with XRE-family HTH domain